MRLDIIFLSLATGLVLGIKASKGECEAKSEAYTTLRHHIKLKDEEYFADVEKALRMVEKANDDIKSAAGMTPAHPLFAGKEGKLAEVLSEKRPVIEQGLADSSNAIKMIADPEIRIKADNLRKATTRALLQPIDHGDGTTSTRKCSEGVRKWLG